MGNQIGIYMGKSAANRRVQYQPFEEVFVIEEGEVHFVGKDKGGERGMGEIDDADKEGKGAH